MKKLMLVSVCALALTACDKFPGSGSANAESGPKQTLEIITTPDGANCALDRKNMTFDRPQNTPVKTTVTKDGSELLVRCIKSGYSQASVTLKPRADKTYESPVTMVLKKKK